MNKKFIISFISVVAIVIVGGIVWVVKNQPSNQANQPEQPNGQVVDNSQWPEVISNEIDTSDWKSYEDKVNGFSINLPTNWKVSNGTSPEGGAPADIRIIPNLSTDEFPKPIFWVGVGVSDGPDRAIEYVRDISSLEKTYLRNDGAKVYKFFKPVSVQPESSDTVIETNAIYAFVTKRQNENKFLNASIFTDGSYNDQYNLDQMVNAIVVSLEFLQ